MKCGVALFRKQIMKIKKDKAKEAVKEASDTLEEKLGGRFIVVVCDVVCFHSLVLDSFQFFIHLFFAPFN